MNSSLLHWICRVVCAVLVASMMQLWAQDDDDFFANYKIQSWSAQNGMSGNTATDIIQAKTGYIYIGTYDGLVRFDGVEFVTFSQFTDKKYNFLSVRCIFQDKDIATWIGSNDEGVYCISKDLSVRSFTTDDGLPSNSIRAIAQDLDGNIWIGTASGIVFIDGEGKVNFPKGLERFDDDKMTVLAIYCDTFGNTFVMGQNNLYIYTDAIIKTIRQSGSTGDDDDAHPPIKISTSARKAFTRYPRLRSFPRNNITAMTQDNLGHYVFAVSPHYVVVQNNDAGTNNAIETVFDVGHGVQQSTVTNKLMADNSGNIWVATNGGLAVIQGKSASGKLNYSGMVSFFDKSMGLIDDDVNSIIQDMEDNIWLATDSGGVAKMSLSKFRNIVADSTINAIAQDRARNVMWVASDDGVHCYDASLWMNENFVTDYCKYIRIRDVYIAQNGDLLVATYEKHGLLRFSGNLTGADKSGDSKNSEWVKMPPSVISYNAQNGLTGNKTRCIAEAANGDIYCGTTTGLNIIKKENVNTELLQNGVFSTSIIENDGREAKITSHISPVAKNIIQFTKQDGVPSEYVMSVCVDIAGTVWVGTDGGGVYTIDSKTLEAKNIYQSDKERTDALLGNVVFKIIELQKGDMWFCTGSGISRFKDGAFINIDAGKGLSVSSVFQMLLDYTDRVWMTSNRGVSSIKMQDIEKFCSGELSSINPQFYTQSDGLHTRGVTSTSKSCKDRYGRIWFTLLDGITIYDPAKSVSNKVSPLTHIQSITCDSGEYPFNGTPIVLPPSNKRLLVKYSGISFLSSDQLLFQYNLKGFDKTENAWTRNRIVSYTNLRPGQYIFSVKAMANNGVESPPSSALFVTKKPYFYQVWYFWVITCINGAMFIAILVVSRFKAMVNYQKKLESEVKKKTQELLRKNVDLEKEKQKSESLLLNILPESIAKELTSRPNEVIADNYDNVTVLFADIVGFTKLSSGLDAGEVVTMLNSLFTRFDMRAKRESIEKIKTIGDCYMAACGLAYGSDPLDSCCKMIEFARGMVEDIREYNICAVGTPPVKVQMRIGINMGSLVAGVIGKTKFIYDIWGDTVNVASRMESTSEPLQIHVSESVYSVANKAFKFDGPFEIAVKGKGSMATYFVEE